MKSEIAEREVHETRDVTFSYENESSRGFARGTR